MLSYRFLPLLILTDTPFQLHVLSRNTYCTLIMLYPWKSLAQYFDSSNTTKKKNYARIKGVLDEAINGYAQNGGTFEKKQECIRLATGKYGFRHVTEFPCIKQPEWSTKEAFYALHYLKGIVRDASNFNQLAKLRVWADKMSVEIEQDDLIEDFHRIKVKLSDIILEDVKIKGGP